MNLTTIIAFLGAIAGMLFALEFTRDCDAITRIVAIIVMTIFGSIFVFLAIIMFGMIFAILILATIIMVIIGFIKLLIAFIAFVFEKL